MRLLYDYEQSRDPGQTSVTEDGVIQIEMNQPLHVYQARKSASTYKWKELEETLHEMVHLKQRHVSLGLCAKHGSTYKK